ncbi:hypothetical protein AC579_1112 [Pseudocercospora musae]|uniref:Uncharacterized protein n=1 Tax=Pseudocercospora musae TaxID=113226 RepID=A0A139HZX6_9PEZI|nr:hypothetical protein AC579_1112 [Pseudocercospora musae]
MAWLGLERWEILEAVKLPIFDMRSLQPYERGIASGLYAYGAMLADIMLCEMPPATVASATFSDPKATRRTGKTAYECLGQILATMLFGCYQVYDISDDNGHIPLSSDYPWFGTEAARMRFINDD